MSNPTDIKKSAITFGIIIGIISFLIGIVSIYLIAFSTSFIVTTIVSSTLSIVISIIIAVIFAVRLRKINGGFWDFGTALKTIALMLIISTIISFSGSTIFNIVNPSIQEKAIENSMNNMAEILEMSGSEDENIDVMMEEMEKTKAEVSNISFGKLLQSLAGTILISFIFALILAAILKKEQPIFIEQEDDGLSKQPW